MNEDVHDMCRKIKDTKLTFVLNPDDVWQKFDESLRVLVGIDWDEIKFLDDSCLLVNEDIKKIPNKSGGIYTFILKPEILPKTHIYILYIGRAKKTISQNLRKRCSEYINDERPKISAMIENWGKDLYIRYLPLDDNDLIDKLERELLNSIIPPCNSEIPDKIIKAAMKQAFM